MSGLDAIFAYRDEPWNLSIEGNAITEAGYGSSLWNYMAAFFTSSHEERLKETATSLLNRVHPFTERQKILLEKIAAVILHHKSSWLHGLQTEMHTPREIKISHSAIERPGLIRPLQEEGRFVNFLGEKIWQQFLQTLYLLFPGTFGRKTECAHVDKLLSTEWKPLARSDAAEISWLGHATVLLQVAGFNLLLDPAFHFCPPCFTRHIPAGIALEDLPLIDAVAISHNHADHCEPKAIRSLAAMQPFMFVPKNFHEWTQSQGCIYVKDHLWWEQTILEREGKTITLTSVPAQHGSQQTLNDINTTLWQGVVIQAEGKTFYFSGDTALQEGLFEQIHNVFPEIDVAFLPIAPEEERAVHLDCEQSLIAFERVGAKTMIPIHWGAYRQSREIVEDPLLRLKAFLDGKYSYLKPQVYISKVGERVSLEQIVERQAESQAI